MAARRGRTARDSLPAKENTMVWLSVDVNGDAIQGISEEADACQGEVESVKVNGDPEYTLTCRTCGGRYDADGPDDEDRECNDDGGHKLVPIPLSWMEHASIRVDEENDTVTLSISVGDPQGAFQFTLTRVPVDAATNAGKLFLHVPYEGMSAPHVPLTRTHGGTFLLG
jgi:hypothetical protein